MKVRLNGKKYGVVYCPLSDIPAKGRKSTVGLCVYSAKTVFIDSGRTRKEQLEIAIHELSHVLKDKWPEKKVKRFSRALSSALWKLGYRRTK
jgi:hypothetical protein